MRLGKGIFIWNIGETDGGNPAAIGARLNSAHIDWIQLKVANGTIKWKIDPAWIARLRAVWSGKIYGWTFCTGLNPSLEACNLAE